MRKRPWHGVLGKTLLGSLLVLGQAQAGTMTRTSSFEYDAARGLLTKEVIEPDNAQLRLETSYTYDARAPRFPLLSIVDQTTNRAWSRM